MCISFKTHIFCMVWDVTLQCPQLKTNRCQYTPFKKQKLTYRWFPSLSGPAPQYRKPSPGDKRGAG